MNTTQTEIAKSNVPSLERHARKCKICKHKDREDIELDFLHWHNCINIVVEYRLDNPRAIYRHAHATGLYERRTLNLRFAAAHIVENAESIEPSASAVLKAIQACSQINDRGEWIDQPRRIIHQHEHYHVPAASPSALQAKPLVGEEPAEERAKKPVEDESETAISNRHWMQLENAATPTKHEAI